MNFILMFLVLFNSTMACSDADDDENSENAYFSYVGGFVKAVFGLVSFSLKPWAFYWDIPDIVKSEKLGIFHISQLQNVEL